MNSYDDTEIWRLQQQMLAFGAARTPLEQSIDDDRVVVAGSQLFRVPKRWSFHQFLISYGLNKLEDKNGGEHKTHILIESLSKGLSQSKELNLKVGAFSAASMSGELYAFLSFSYDMFTLSDNAAVQEKLLHRILDSTQFQGARYEVFVAASLIRAGFEIAFEDENDVSKSHCEFSAIWKTSGKQYSVEAKSRHRDASEKNVPTKANMYRMLQQALKKSADHERLIFADVNLPADRHPLLQQEWHRDVSETLKRLEDNQRPENPWPQAMIFFTNRITSPWPGQAEAGGSTVLLTAINHPLFRSSDRKPVERQYPEIGKLFHSTMELGVPPSTFFGQ